MKKTTVVAIIGIIRKDNKYLLTKRVHEEKQYHDKWQFPGGELEFGETAQECLRRELREEVGVSVTIQKLLPKILTRTDRNKHYVLISYLCQLGCPNASIKLDSEASQYGWYTFEEIKKLEQIPQLTEIAAEAERSSKICYNER